MIARDAHEGMALSSGCSKVPIIKVLLNLFFVGKIPTIISLISLFLGWKLKILRQIWKFSTKK